MDSLLDQKYYVQEELRCCVNCKNNDVTIDVMGNRELVCGLYGVEVEQTGICDQFKWS
jgi:hypothetical protein